MGGELRAVGAARWRGFIQGRGGARETRLLQTVQGHGGAAALCVLGGRDGGGLRPSFPVQLRAPSFLSLTSPFSGR